MQQLMSHQNIKRFYSSSYNRFCYLPSIVLLIFEIEVINTSFHFFIAFFVPLEHVFHFSLCLYKQNDASYKSFDIGSFAFYMFFCSSPLFIWTKASVTKQSVLVMLYHLVPGFYLFMFCLFRVFRVAFPNIFAIHWYLYIYSMTVKLQQ